MATTTCSKPKVKSLQKTNSQNKIKKSKNVLCIPNAWPKLEETANRDILEALKVLLLSLPIKLPKRPVSYFHKKKKQAKVQKESIDVIKEEETHLAETNNEEARAKELRSQLVYGVRCVTKGLERDELELIIVCRSTKPEVITAHLIPLADSRACPALCVSNFNLVIAPHLGVSSLVVMGFKKQKESMKSDFSEFIAFAKEYCRPLKTLFAKKTLNPAKNIFSGGDSVASSRLDNLSTVALLDKEITIKSDHVLTPLDKQVSDQASSKTIPISSDRILPKTNSITNIKIEKVALDGPPLFVHKDDYSYLYVFKAKDSEFGDDFITVGRSKRKRVISMAPKLEPPVKTVVVDNVEEDGVTGGDYISANIQGQVHNVKRSESIRARQKKKFKNT